MKILYIANLRLPTEKAYGIQIAKMGEAFADLGLEVVLAAPFRISKEKGSISHYYGVRENFKFRKIFTPDFYFPGRLDIIAFQIKSFISAFILAVYALTHKSDIVFSRDEMPLYLLSFFRGNLVFEAHKFSKKRLSFYKRFKKKKVKIVAISSGIKNEFEKIGFNPESILIAPDAVDLRDFDINISKTEARKKLGLPLDKKIALYSGHFFKWKGVDTLMEAAAYLKEVFFVFIGGTEKRTLDNILFLGHKPYREVPLYLKAADVLILPNPATLSSGVGEKEEKISKYYTSPLKLFEYMASGRPIVASDLPSIKEVLDKDSAVFFKPGNSEELARSIKKIIDDENLAKSISEKAFEKVQEYTWEKRVKKILVFVG